MENNNKGQSIFLSIIAIMTLIVATFGTVLAWFAINMKDSKENKEIVNKLLVTKVIFDNSNEINIKNNINYNLPIKKTFNISNFDNASTDKINYNIYLNIEKNSLSEVINENGEYFTYTLVGNSSNNKGNISKDITNRVIEDKDKILLGSATLYGNDTHSYEFIINIKKGDKDLKLLNSKEFNAFISIESQ